MGSNADIIKSAYDAFAQQDIPAVLAAFDPDIAWYTPDTVRFGGTFKGHDEVVGFFSKLPESYTELRVEPDEFIESGDRVVVLGHLRGKAAGGDFDERFAHVWSFTDGKATSFEEFFDTVRIGKAIGD